MKVSGNNYSFELNNTLDNTSQKNKDKRSIDGSAIGEKLDPLAAKKKEAQKKAMQIVSSAFSNELKIDASLDERRERINSLKKDIEDNQSIIKNIEEKRNALFEEYGVEPDSKEAENLKLLEKEMRSRMPGSKVSISKDEMEALAKIKKDGLSEFQSRSLELFGDELHFHGIIDDAKREISVENQIIRATDLERLKSHTMEDAQKQADSYLKAASQEIIQMAADEAKEHVDEENEKLHEKAKVEKEKKEAEKERIEAKKNRDKSTEHMTEDILEQSNKLLINSADSSVAVRQEVKEMMSKMKLIEEDVKGAAVDKVL